MVATLGLVLSIGILTTIHSQQAFASPSPGVHDNAAITGPTHVPIQGIIDNVKDSLANIKKIIASIKETLGPFLPGIITKSPE